MAEVVEVIEPSEKQYLIKLSESELDFIVGIVSDLADNPQRRVRMVYEVDEDYVQPTELGLKTAASITRALGSMLMSENYDYYTYWENVKADVAWL